MENILSRVLKSLDDGVQDALIKTSWAMDSWLEGPSPEIALDQAICDANSQGVDKAIKEGATSRTHYDLIRENLSKCKNPDDPERFKVLDAILANRESLNYAQQGRTHYKEGGPLKACLDFNNPKHFKAIEKAMRQDNIEYVNIAPDIKRAIENGRTDVVKTALESSYFQKNASTSLLVDALETGNKEIAKTLISFGGDPTIYKSHVPLKNLEKEYSQSPSKEIENRLKLTLGLYKEKDLKEVLENKENQWGQAVIGFCKSVIEKKESKTKEATAMEI
jgi:hypothetical protein